MFEETENMETRCITSSEFRIDRSGKAPKIVGHAAMFNVWTDIGGWFKERIAPGAFKNSIKNDDVRALIEHNPQFVLGRNKSGTLKLKEDSKGLAIEIIPPDTTDAIDLMKRMERSDVTQMSYGFQVKRQELDYETDERTLLEVKLFDVSVVTYPAEPTTSAEVRSLFHKEDPTESITVEDWTEFDVVITKIKAGEELTEDDVRALTDYIPKEDELNPRDLERALRDAGCSRKQAKEILAKGFMTQEERDALIEEEDPSRDAEPAKGKVNDLLIRAELIAPSM